MIEMDSVPDDRIDSARLNRRLAVLGGIGRDSTGRLTRLAASEADGLARDTLVGWMRDVGLKVRIDRIGNIFGVWETAANADLDAVLVGSHIDTVIDAGILDGCYGVLAGLEAIQTLKLAGHEPSCPIAVVAFTNEEGVRYAPDMMGSLVHTGGLSVDEALTKRGTDGSVLAEELRRIGYAGSDEPGSVRARAYVELHIEQGPILEAAGISIGVVTGLQGISWKRVTVRGKANHAGTTPMSMRQDAGSAAARMVTVLNDQARCVEGTVATVGTMLFEPNAINVIPSRAIFTVDLRNPDESRLSSVEARLSALVEDVASTVKVDVKVEDLVRTTPVEFDEKMVALIEAAAHERGLPTMRVTSGAGHDAQMLARICPTAMIFVPSRDGVSHNPAESTSPGDIKRGASVLLDVVKRLTSAA